MREALTPARTAAQAAGLLTECVATPYWHEDAVVMAILTRCRQELRTLALARIAEAKRTMRQRRQSGVSDA